MSEIFGGSSGKSQSQSTSGNNAYPYLQGAFGGTVNNGTGAGNQLAAMLGLGGTQGQDDAFKNWQGSTGYQFGLNEGTKAVSGNAASAGVLNSGSAAKALQNYGQQYANTQYGNYTNQLQDLMNGGLQAGNLISGAGQFSNSTSTSKQKSNNGGLGSALGHFIPGVGALMGK